MCFSMVRVPIPFFQDAYSYLALFFLLSEMQEIGYHVKRLKSTILWPLMITMLIATVLLLLNSPHFLSINGFFELFKSELLIKYFVIVYALICLRKEADLRIIYKASLIGLLILTVFSIINYVQGYSYIVNELAKGRDVHAGWDHAGVDVGEKYSDSDRFRLQSLFFLAFDYGYVCAILLLFYLHGMHNKYLSQKLSLLAVLCCLFGVILSNCRTVIVSTLFSVGVYYYIIYGKKQILYLILFSFLSYTFYSSNPQFQEFVDTKVISVFGYRDNNISGSSIEMREIQYLAVFSHVQDSYLFGKGKNYFLIDMGWKDGKDYLADERLQGLEGIFLNLILERGVVGILFWLFFYGGLLFYFIRNKNDNIKGASLGISCLTLYFIESNMTGEMGCVYPTMLIMGIALFELYRFDQKNQRPFLLKQG